MARDEKDGKGSDGLSPYQRDLMKQVLEQMDTGGFDEAEYRWRVDWGQKVITPRQIGKTMKITDRSPGEMPTHEAMTSTTYKVLHRPNNHGGHCVHCQTVVPERHGHLLKDDRGTFKTMHRECLRELMSSAGVNPKADQITLMDKVSDAARPFIEPPKKKEETMEDAAKAVKKAGLLKSAEKVADHFEDQMNELQSKIVDEQTEAWLENVPPLVERLLEQARPVNISVGDMPAVKIDRTHKALDDILMAVVAGASPFLVGPAGSGKTTLAEQIAKVLKRDFYMAARVTSEYKLTGFVDANGKCVTTAFRDAYESGGLFLFDEVDASDPDAMTSFNAALANTHADFPDGLVERHPDFIALAAGNTYGRGADRQYVGRSQLDAATLDRFQIFDVDYDEELELELGCDRKWTKYVQRMRKNAEQANIRHIISPRASIIGGKLLTAGMDADKVEQATIWKGLDPDQVKRCNDGMRYRR